MCCCKYVRVTQ